MAVFLLKHAHEYYNEEEDKVSRNDCHQHKEMIIVNGVKVYELGSHHNPDPDRGVNGDGHDGSSNGCAIAATPTTEDNTPVILTPTTPTIPTTRTTPTTPTTPIDEPEEPVIPDNEPVELVYHEYQWYKGFNLVSFPVLKEGIETISDLYNAYALFQPFELISEEPLEYTGDLIYVILDGCWFPYAGESDNVIGDIRITPYLGVAMLMDWSALVGMRGQRLIGDGVFELKSGTNIVGITEMPVGIEKPSDFLRIDGVEAVLSCGIEDLGRKREWYLIGREGDPGDHIPVALGQAYIIISTSESMIEFGGVMAAPAAPTAPHSDTLATPWGAMKQ